MKRLFLNGLSLWIIDYLFSGIVISGESLIVLTLIFALCNAFVKPVLQFFSIPFSLMTFGLFSLIINGAVLSLAFTLVSGAYINGLGTAILASIVLGLVNGVLTDIFDKK